VDGRLWAEDRFLSSIPATRHGAELDREHTLFAIAGIWTIATEEHPDALPVRWPRKLQALHDVLFRLAHVGPVIARDSDKQQVPIYIDVQRANDSIAMAQRT
jgi:hypothetical protein